MGRVDVDKCANPMDKAKSTEDAVPEAVVPLTQGQPHAEPIPEAGSIVGIPWSEVRAWMLTWGTNHKTSAPKPRRFK